MNRKAAMIFGYIPSNREKTNPKPIRTTNSKKIERGKNANQMRPAIRMYPAIIMAAVQRAKKRK